MEQIYFSFGLIASSIGMMLLKEIQPVVVQSASKSRLKRIYICVDDYVLNLEMEDLCNLVRKCTGNRVSVASLERMDHPTILVGCEFPDPKPCLVLLV